MYHIRNDQRSHRSAQLIYEALVERLRHKDFDQITVTDIQRATGVARSTFYRCFDNLPDVLYWQCDQCFRQAMACPEPGAPPDEATLIRHYLSYWMTHSQLPELLIRINRLDIFYSCHLKNAQLLAQTFGVLPGLTGEEARYFLTIRTGMTLSILQAWLEGGQKETADQLLDILRKSVHIGSL